MEKFITSDWSFVVSSFSICISASGRQSADYILGYTDKIFLVDTPNVVISISVSSIIIGRVKTFVVLLNPVMSL